MKPVLLTLDDDPQVLLAIERDLRQALWQAFSRSKSRVRYKGPCNSQTVEIKK